MVGIKSKIATFIETVLDFVLDNFIPYGLLSKTSLRRVVVPRSIYFHYVFNQKTQRLELLHRMSKAGVKPFKVAEVWWSRGLCNFGDELMGYLLAHMAGVDCKFDRQMALIGIGSTVRFARDNSYVWGSGMMRDGEVMTGKPRILAVRGPLTRQNLLDQGLVSPSVYGDPAMLFPLFYKPKKHHQKSEKSLIVPHFKHVDLQCHHDNYDYVDLRINSIRDIEYIVDRIACAPCVVTSSLHGFIFCVAYQIPVVVFKLEGHPIGGDNIKFDDFCQGVGIDGVLPIYAIDDTDEDSMDELISKARVYKQNWAPIGLLQSLYEIFPTPVLSGFIEQALLDRTLVNKT